MVNKIGKSVVFYAVELLVLLIVFVISINTNWFHLSAVSFCLGYWFSYLELKILD